MMKGSEKGKVKTKGIKIVSKGKVTPVNSKKKAGAKGALATPPSSAKSRGKRKAIETAPETPPTKKRRVLLIVKPPAGHESKPSQQETPKTLPRKTVARRTPATSTKKTKSPARPTTQARKGCQPAKPVSVPRVILKLPAKAPAQPVVKAPITPPPSHSYPHPHGYIIRQVPDVIITIPPRHHIRRLSDSSLSSLTSQSSTSSILLTPPASTKKDRGNVNMGTPYLTMPPAPRARRNTGTPATVAPLASPSRIGNSHGCNLNLPTRFDPVRDCIRSIDDKQLGRDSDSDADSVLDGSLIRTLQYGLRSSTASSRASSSVAY